MGITAPIWNINFFSLTCAWIKSQKWIVTLSYQSQNLLNFSYHFGGDSTLVPRVTNVRDWSKHRFRQLIVISLHEAKSEKLSPIFMKSSFLWHYLLKWIYLVYTNGLLPVFNLEVMILQLYASSRYCWHSLSFTLASPTPLRQKKIHYFFNGQKFHSLVRKTIRPIRIWVVYFLINKSFFFFFFQI